MFLYFFCLSILLYWRGCQRKRRLCATISSDPNLRKNATLLLSHASFTQYYFVFMIKENETTCLS